MITVCLTYDRYNLKVNLTGSDMIPQKLLDGIQGYRIHQWLKELLRELRIVFSKEKQVKLLFCGDSEDAVFVERVIRSENLQGNACPIWTLETKTEYVPVDKRIAELQNLVRNEYDGCISDINRNKLERQMDSLSRREFEVPVVSVRSSGKSTLVNALLREYLSPVSVRACTRKIISFEDCDTLKTNKAIVYENSSFYERQGVGIEDVRKWNLSPSVDSVQIRGDIPGVREYGRLSLVLVDTPGVDGSDDQNCRKSVLKMLRERSPSLIVYILDSEHYDTNDNVLFLKDVCGTLNEETDARDVSDHILFVVNKIDRCADACGEERDVVSSTLNDICTFLKRCGIEKPALLPLSAKTAAVIRHAHPEQMRDSQIFLRDPQLINLLEKSKKICGEVVYSEQIRQMTESPDNEKIVEILTGIKLLETWLSDMLQMYATPAKFADCVRFLRSSVMEMQQEKQEQIQGLKAELETLKERDRENVARLEAFRSLIEFKKFYNEGKTDAKRRKAEIERFVVFEEAGYSGFRQRHIQELNEVIAEACRECDSFLDDLKDNMWESIREKYAIYFDEKLVPRWEGVFHDACMRFKERISEWDCLVESEQTEIPPFDSNGAPFMLNETVSSRALKKADLNWLRSGLDSVRSFFSSKKTVRFDVDYINAAIESDFSAWLDEKKETMGNEFWQYYQKAVNKKLSDLKTYTETEETLTANMNRTASEIKDRKSEMYNAEEKLNRCSEFLDKLENLMTL